MSLNDMALNVLDLSEKCKELRDRAQEVGLLATRRGQLRQISDSIKALALASEVLSQEPSVHPDLEAVRGVSQKLRVRTNTLLRKMEVSSEALLKPKALDAFDVELLAAIERGLLNTWRRFLGTDGQPGIETVLTRYIALKATVERIKNLRLTLQTLGAQLPSTTHVLDQARSAKVDLAKQLSSLVSSGLDEEVVTFLRRSVEGVSLSDLLSNERVLVWLKAQGLTPYFRVRTV